jgi:hypothetical protein
MEEPIGLDEGWEKTHAAILKIIKIIEGGSSEDFPVAESSEAYTIVYRMCTQKNGNHTEAMYGRYSESFKEYLLQTVLPAVRSLEGVEMLKELNQRWKNQRQMMKYLSNIFFKYLDRYHVPRHNLDSTRIVALKCFKAQVFDPIKDRVRAAMLDLIHNEREGDSVDHRLLKAIVSVLSQPQFLPGSMALILLSLRFFVKWDSATTSIRLQMVSPNQKLPCHAIRRTLRRNSSSALTLIMHRRRVP